MDLVFVLKWVKSVIRCMIYIFHLSYFGVSSFHMVMWHLLFLQDEMIDQRRLLVFKADKLEKIVGLVKSSFPIS